MNSKKLWVLLSALTEGSCTYSGLKYGLGMTINESFYLTQECLVHRMIDGAGIYFHITPKGQREYLRLNAIYSALQGVA
jgi:hypothetical protein